MQKNQNRPGCKNTKAGWIPEGWRVVPLAEIATVERGKFSVRPRNDPRYYGGPYPFLQTGDVSGADGVVKSHTQSLNEDGLAVSRLFPAGTLLVTIAANIGDVAEVPFAFACPDSLVAIQSKSGTSRSWLKHLLVTKKNFFSSKATQNAQANINLGTIRPVAIPLPSLSEQEAIAGVLECWDKAIRMIERKIENKRKVKKGLMQQLLSGQRRLPGFRGKWGNVRLGDIAAPIKTVVGEKVVTPMSLSAGIGFVPQETKFGKDISGAQYQHYTLLTKGCFAYNKGNSKKYPQGCIYLLEEHDEVAVPNVFVCFKLDPSAAVDEYFRQVFLANMHGPELVRFINSGVRNNGLLNLTASNFFQIKLPLPPLPEQRAIAAVLSAADAEIAVLERKLGALREQKRFLLNNLVTGAIRLPKFRTLRSSVSSAVTTTKPPRKRRRAKGGGAK